MGNCDGNTDETNEDITYSLYTPDDGIGKLGRKSPSSANNMPVAENVEALDFVYLDSDGKPTVTLSEIRAIQVTLVAKTARPNPRYIDTRDYYNIEPAPHGPRVVLPAQNDHFRRRVLATHIKCRNLGL